jgi:hypothetical protein
MRKVIDEHKPQVIYKGKPYIYINKKGQMYKVRPLDKASEKTHLFSAQDTSEDIWVHESELTQDKERNYKNL